ncbi:MAG: ATP synthase F0 subunit B [Deltaproteobacteria bacterium]|nr:ATP synthase F0 subunit B [Deltaproteobacteria bacterium]
MGHERIGEIFNFGVLHLEWPTALYIFVVFLITMFLLNTWLFKPILRTLENRRKVNDKNLETIKNLSTAIDASRETYLSKLEKTQKEILGEQQRGIETASRQAKEILDAARKISDEKIEEAFAEIRREKEDALVLAKKLTQDLAESIQKKSFK